MVSGPLPVWLHREATWNVRLERHHGRCLRRHFHLDVVAMEGGSPDKIGAAKTRLETLLSHIPEEQA